MKSISKISQGRPKGFSLIELLVVIAILAVMATFIGPAARSLTMGNATTSASQTVTNQIAIARQAALTKNTNVELRFLKFADTDKPGETVGDEGSWRIRAVQTYEIKPDGTAVAISRMQRLPDTAIIDSNAQWTSLVSTEKSDGDKLPKVGNSYKYYPIRFKASGRTSLDPNKAWFLTIHDSQFGDNLGKLPANYVTVQVDPIQGTTKMYRPGVQ